MFYNTVVLGECIAQRERVMVYPAHRLRER